MTEWREISTAPKDGTVVDLWAQLNGGERVTDAYWGQRSADKAQREHFGFEEFGWCRDADDSWVYPVTFPTHWMPLPSPPSPTTEQRAS